MKRLHNALLLKQLLILKQLGFKYTHTTPSKLQDEQAELPNDMKALKILVDHCQLCELSKSRQKSVFGEGNTNADIMFIGEEPSATEDSTGRPFVGRSGDMLTKMIENVLHISRANVYITNVLKCKSLDSKISVSAEIVTCKPYILKQIELIKPKIIVTLGISALRILTDNQDSLESVRGHEIKYNDSIIIPTYHPIYLLRNPSAKKEALEDLLRVKELLSS